VRTAGIDLASQDLKTGLCVIEWTEGIARIEKLDRGVSDDAILSTLHDADMTGIDVPLGWPTAFAEAVWEHANLRPWPVSYHHENNVDYRYRRTDQWVQRLADMPPPLSVSSDRIAIPAMRAAAVLRRFDADCPRDGSGKVCEVYPAAALKVWGFQSRGYKGREHASARDALVASLVERGRPWLELDETARRKCVESDDALDALIAALVARFQFFGLTEPIYPADFAPATTEGWIAMPMEGTFEHLGMTERALGTYSRMQMGPVQVLREADGTWLHPPETE